MKRTRSSSSRDSQRGSAPLIALLIALGVASAALPWAHQMMAREATDDLAKSAGRDMAQLAMGVRGAISKLQTLNKADEAAAAARAAQIEANGIDYLRPRECSENPAFPTVEEFAEDWQGYIPCRAARYGEYETPFMADYDLTVDTTAPGSGYYEIRMGYVVNTPADQGRAGVVASRIANSAHESMTVAETVEAAGGIHKTFQANIASDFDFNQPAAVIQQEIQDAQAHDMGHPDFGRVMLVASADSEADIWLRIDGLNHMEADLYAAEPGSDPVDWHDIRHARNIELSGEAVIAEDVYVGGTTFIQESLRTEENVNAGIDVIAERNVIGEQNVVAGQNVKAETGSVEAGQHLIANEYIFGRDVLLDDIGRLASQGVYDVTVINGSGWMEKPSCGPFTGEPRIFTAVQGITPNDGRPMHGHEVFVTDGGDRWDIEPRILTNTGWESTDNANIIAMAKCG